MHNTLNKCGRFPEGLMTDEAATFMYLGEAIEEMDLNIE